MQLREWLEKEGLDISRMADRMGCNRNHLGEIISGKRTPGRMLARLIELETQGEVCYGIPSRTAAASAFDQGWRELGKVTRKMWLKAAERGERLHIPQPEQLIEMMK